eukprot:4510786-Prymnesium_polylepis.2
MKFLAIGKTSGYQRVTILGAIFESPVQQQDSAAERDQKLHGRKKFPTKGTAQHDDATTGENARRHTSVRSDTASAWQTRSAERRDAQGGGSAGGGDAAHGGGGDRALRPGRVSGRGGGRGAAGVSIAGCT